MTKYDFQEARLAILAMFEPLQLDLISFLDNFSFGEYSDCTILLLLIPNWLQFDTITFWVNFVCKLG